MENHEKDIRWQQRFSNMTKAYQQLLEFPDYAAQNKFEKQGLIKAFEYTFELSWKTLQDFLEEKGFEEVRGPRPVIEQSFQDGYVSDGEGWMDMLKDRNRTSHTYQVEVVEEIAKKIVSDYISLFGALIERLEHEKRT